MIRVYEDLSSLRRQAQRTTPALPLRLKCCVRHAPDMPELSEDAATLGMNGIVDNEFNAKQYAALGLDLSFIPFRPAANYIYVVFWRHGNEK